MSVKSCEIVALVIRLKQRGNRMEKLQILEVFLVAFVALSHVGFLVLEMFYWQTPKGQKIFKIDAEFAKKSAALAANQGLYNGFLAAGLFWGLIVGGVEGQHLKIFFLTCVVIAGIYGGFTASKNIFKVQALPGFLALLAVCFF